MLWIKRGKKTSLRTEERGGCQLHYGGGNSRTRELYGRGVETFWGAMSAEGIYKPGGSRGGENRALL